MKSLYEILQDKELIEKIISIFQGFGYSSDVRVFCGEMITEEENIITLSFAISRDNAKESPWNSRPLLEAKLSSLLQCQVDVIRLQAHNELDAGAIYRISAPLIDEEKIRELFKVKSTKAIFLNDEQKPNPDTVKRADEYLVKVGYVESSTDVAAERVQKKNKIDEVDSPPEDTTSVSKTPSPSSGPGRK